MKNKNKYKATVKSKRQDYTKGGRVGYLKGQMVDGEFVERRTNKNEAQKAAEAAKKAQADAAAAQAKAIQKAKDDEAAAAQKIIDDEAAAAQKIIDDEAARIKAIADKEAADAETLRISGLTDEQKTLEEKAAADKAAADKIAADKAAADKAAADKIAADKEAARLQAIEDAKDPFDSPTYKSPFSNKFKEELTQAQRDRELRLEEAGQRVDDIASGKQGIPEAAKGKAELLGDKDDIDLDPDTTAYKVDTPDAVGADDVTEDLTRKVKADGSRKLVDDPDEVTEATMTNIATVDEAAVIDAAEGKLSAEVSESLANAAGIAEVAEREFATVEIIEGALTERVIGKISASAKAEAATVAGTTVARITRAKKQLASAGLTDTQITAIGNDPQDLEARLTDFTEAERNIIEGLPVEALVSTQLDSLLKGMEDGNIPVWANPAVSAVEKMLAKRGMSSSTVGRDGLVNAIVTSAIPLAQANAQAIQASVGQQKSIEAQAELTNAQFRQSTAMTNAQNVFNMDMAQFTSDQQVALSNSKFLQTVSLTNSSNEQASIVQNAGLMAQRNLAEADQNTKLGITNAQSFLQMDMANLNNEQQSVVLSAQLDQQRMLSNAGATNAAKQFNATSANQVNQFMAQLATNVDLSNAQRSDAMAQFNLTQQNQAFAQEFQAEAEAEKFNAQLNAQVDQFNSQQEFAKDQFNAQNRLAIDQSNVQWRRDIAKADTAVQNQVNMQNAQNTFAMSQAAQANLWQEMRDEFDYIFKASENAENRKTNIAVAGLQGGEGSAHKKDGWMNNLYDLIDTLG